ncbi:hypothetical protein CTEN210_03142 [Chaetoceros tenuissimus]|uniref:Uncharacterized protein n=1 Tax=Chaetoceros tenuissimus TaxID=426638 RepID=A0AAD3H1H5_9STRA|nr:hypothetical protein CTEN210_03142 [Chaetoceros tenuissimus]
MESSFRNMFLAVLVVSHFAIASAALSLNIEQARVQSKNAVRETKTALFAENSLSSRPRIPVKPRRLMKLDPETGRYVPTKEEIDASLLKTPKEEKKSLWKSFKNGIYGTADFVKGKKKGKKQNTMENAYSDTVESKLKSSYRVPRAISPNVVVDDVVTMEKDIINSFDSSLKTSPLVVNKDLSTGENLYQSDLRKSFESAKDVIYNTVDSLSAEKSEKAKMAVEEHKVVAKPSRNKDKIVQAVPALKSSNPLTRMKANLAIASEERRRRRAIEQEKRDATFNSIKQVLFDFVENIQVAYAAILNIPNEVEQSVAKTQYQIEGAIDEIQKTPKNIQNFVDGTIKSVEEGQKAVVKAVDDVKQIPRKMSETVTSTVKDVQATVEEIQAIPSKVNNSIEETKKSINDTKKSIEGFVQEVRYVTGVEKRPPPPPPTPEEARKELAKKVVKETVSLAGKATIVVAKGTAGMAVSGAKLAMQAAATARKDEEQKKKEALIAQQQMKMQASIDVPTPRSIAEIDEDLDKEVAEALRLAELVGTKTDTKEETKPESTSISTSESKLPLQKKIPRRRPVAVAPKDIDINEAVFKAKQAAYKAQKDVDEMKEILQDNIVAK